MGLTRYVNLLSSWRDLRNELLWSFSSEEPCPEKLSFPLEPEKLGQTLIRWPTVYQWPVAIAYVNHLRVGCMKYVPVQQADIAQPYAGIVLIEVIFDGRKHEIVVDYSDYLDRIDEDALKRCTVYFKMQYFAEGYDSARYETNKIVPGGYINGNQMIYKYLPHIRELGRTKSSLYDVYGRFGLQFAGDIRKKAVGLLSEQNFFHYEGGLKLVRYSRFLLDAARSKICIDLPSNSDYCFRLVDYLALGACIVAPPHRTRMHVPLEDRKHLVYAREDLSDLVDLCRYYVENDGERKRIQHNSRDYFEKYLHRNQLAAYYLQRCLEFMS